MPIQVEYGFEWDPAKAVENFHKHGVSFEDSSVVFIDPNALTLFDQEHSQGEERWITTGLDAKGALVIVCHTFKAETPKAVAIRLISVRKANPLEARQYRREK